MADANAGRLKCLLLPLQSGTLLLPNSVVAEIVPAQRHHRGGDSSRPDWYIGHIEWRGTSLPLISLESLFDSVAREFPAKSSFVVLHRLQDTDGEDYYAVYIDGIPHFQFVDEAAVQTLSTAPNMPYIAHEVSIDGASAMIPDLDAVERKLDTLDAEA